MRIGIDIDGVLYPWDECARDALVAKFGIPRPGPSVSWHYLKEHLPSEQWSWLWTPEGQDASFSQIHRTYPGAVEAVDYLLRRHECHFVTHRSPERAGLHTLAFLKRHFGRRPWAGVHVITAATEKHSLARWDAFIDDKAETVLDMITLTGAHDVFAPVRPWNTELASVTLGASRLTLYDDPMEIVERLAA